MCAKIVSSAGTKKGAKMASVFNRGGVLYIQYIVDGKKVQRSTRLKDTRENRKYIQEQVIPALERRLAMGIGAKEEDIRLKRFAYMYLKEKEHLKTYDQIDSIVEKILAHFRKDTKIDTIKTSQIRSWLMSVATKRSTIQNYKSVLNGIFDIALQDDIIERNPVSAVKIKTREEKPEIVPFSTEEVRLLLQNAEGWFRNFLGISFYTGMRTGEVLALMIGDIKDDHIVVRRSVRSGKISTTKTGKERLVPILEPAKEFLRSQISITTKNRSMYLFTDENGKLIDASWRLRPHWKKLLRACKIADRRIYNTRHTFIVSMLKSQTVSVLELAQIVGHVGPEMIYKNYARYIKGEQLKINRSLDPFADNFADSRKLKRIGES